MPGGSVSLQCERRGKVQQLIPPSGNRCDHHVRNDVFEMVDLTPLGTGVFEMSDFTRRAQMFLRRSIYKGRAPTSLFHRGFE